MFRVSSKKALSQEYKCKVDLLVPGEQIEVSYNVNNTGQDLMDEVAREIDLLDRDYYGLRFKGHKEWLDPTKTVVKQTKNLETVSFELRFKYYPAEPALLANESTRYYLYLQLRLDLLEGRLKSESQDHLAYLIACVLQSELGDHKPEPRKDKQQEEVNYVAEFKFVPNQTVELELDAIRLHQCEDFQGLTPADAELNFLKKACQLDTYGIDPYPVKEGNSHNHFLIGVNHLGIATIQDSRKTNQFSWDEIDRIALDNKLVLIYCRKLSRLGDKSSKSRPLFGFRCPTQTYAHNFWKIATEHRWFFTLDSTPETPIVTNTGGLFKKNHKLKYVGRVEKDLLRDNVNEQRSVGVKRSHSLMSKSHDGPRWQGFPLGNSLQRAVSNIYTSDLLNKTMPANLNYLCEEDEETLENEGKSTGQQSPKLKHVYQDTRNARPSTDSLSKGSPKVFTRRSVLTTKEEVTSASAIRRGSQIYMDTDQKSHDFVKTSILLVVVLAIFLLAILLISDSDRPNSVSLIVNKLNLEPVSQVLRQNYYLPLKSALKKSLDQLLSSLGVNLP